MNRRALLLLAICSAGCSAGTMGGGAALGTPVADFRPDDRVVLRDMRTVQAVAASFERAYAVYPSAVGLYRQGQRRWTALFEAPAPDALRRVFQALIDPLDQSLWLADPTALLHFDPISDRWERYPIGGGIVGLASDPTTPDGIWVQTGNGWFVQPRIGAPRRATPGPQLRRAPTLEDAFDAMPALRSRAAIIAQGPGLRPGRLTSAAPDPATATWFVGTELRGLLQFDVAGITAQEFPQGITGNQVGAVASVPEGVWVGSTDRGGFQPLSLEFLTGDLATTTSIPGNPVFGLRANRIARILPGERHLWLATDIGVTRVNIDDGALTNWNSSDGLTDDRVLALAPWGSGIAVGMERGLAFIGADGTVTRPIVPVLDRVSDLHARVDTLWAATTRGLQYLVPGDTALARAAGAAVDPVSGIGVYAVRSAGDTLLALTRRRVIWRDPVTGQWTPGPDLSGQAGTLRLMEVGPGGLWIAGDRGAVLTRVGTGVFAALTVGRDLPAPITALAIDAEYLWVGTLDGLVRIRLSR